MDKLRADLNAIHKEILSLYNDDDASFFSFLDGECGFYAKFIASKIGLSADITKAILRDMRNRGLLVFSPIVDTDRGCPSGGGYFLTSKGKRAVMEPALPAPKFKPLEWAQSGEKGEIGERYTVTLPIHGRLTITSYAVGWDVELSTIGRVEDFLYTLFDTAEKAKTAAEAEYQRFMADTLAKQGAGR